MTVLIQDPDVICRDGRYYRFNRMALAWEEVFPEPMETPILECEPLKEYGPYLELGGGTRMYLDEGGKKVAFTFRPEVIKYHERCPRCGSTLITNGRVVWCTYVGDGNQDRSCEFRATLQMKQVKETWTITQRPESNRSQDGDES